MQPGPQHERGLQLEFNDVEFPYGGREYIRRAGRQQAGLESKAQHDGDNDGRDVRSKRGRDEPIRDTEVCPDQGKVAQGGHEP